MSEDVTKALADNLATETMKRILAEQDAESLRLELTQLKSWNAELMGAMQLRVRRLEIIQDWIRAQYIEIAKLPLEWRADAASVNDPKSPSIYVDCAERLEMAMNNEPPPEVEAASATEERS